MKKDNDKYRPLEAHLLQSKVGGHYSIMVTLPNGGFIVGAIFPNLSPSVTEQYDLVPDPEGAPVFETSTVITLKLKNDE